MSSTDTKIVVSPKVAASSIPASTSSEYNRFLADHVATAMQMIRSSKDWKKDKFYNTKVGGVVETRSSSSGLQGREAKLAWHLRDSIHNPTETGLDFDDFRNGLLVDHQLKEEQYIPDVIEVKMVEATREKQAEIWRNSYKMPLGIGNRDFLQLQLMLDLPPHAEPFSEAHQDLAVSELLRVETPASVAQQTQVRTAPRSFLVIQLPVDHPQHPERKGEFIRAAYASVEAVWELGGNIGWLMMVQSDAAGKIPVSLQEMSLSGKIAEDVPHFIGWAQKVKGGTQKPSS